MNKKLLLTPVIDNLIHQRIIDNGLDPVILKSEDEKSILDKASDVDAAILMELPFPNSMFDQMPNLKIIARQGVGYDNVDTQVAAKHNVWVTNTPGGNAVSVAENVITDMLLLSKHSYTISNKMREGDSDYGQTIMSTQITDKTLGIVGFGHIGQEVAKRAQALGMNVLIYNRTPKDTNYGKFVSKEELFKNSDYVTLHLPAVSGTINTVSTDEFKMMKKSAYLLNLGRGPLVDQDAFVDAIKNKEIAGAALDVYDKEPLPMDSPIRKLDNVFLTPHCAGHSIEGWTKMANQALDNVLAVLNGDKPADAVNEVK
ncbi:phosphoglycerate dehydrogenase [Lactobacillus sp. Sy-1]|uniref:phosphoglycerate dehydrogenase n=1 Tax=Lactobacillus sp. Sy-1 TaxID=2109645 RepID=UPI001C5AF53A|nr:phosphoglycerate dehydrogenase [Lactobacillus sp. Sy-1]MBW1606087.1 phosphoglycerate dehydrogenase [Lactobacillus sp. Sy-1]